jgi:DNA-binding Lrp family transcriptional regulator
VKPKADVQAKPLLRISEDLSLPAEAVTETFAILANRGVGKTYTASVLVEELLKAGLQVAVSDPGGVWWGLRASADGTVPGLPIVVVSMSKAIRASVGATVRKYSAKRWDMVTASIIRVATAQTSITKTPGTL